MNHRAKEQNHAGLSADRSSKLRRLTTTSHGAVSEAASTVGYAGASSKNKRLIPGRPST